MKYKCNYVRLLCWSVLQTSGPSEFSFSKSVKDPDTASSLCPCYPPRPLFNFPAAVNMKTDNKNNANTLCSLLAKFCFSGICFFMWRCCCHLFIISIVHRSKNAIITGVDQLFAKIDGGRELAAIFRVIFGSHILNPVVITSSHSCCCQNHKTNEPNRFLDFRFSTKVKKFVEEDHD